MTDEGSAGRAFPWAGVFVLAALTFVAITSEYLPAGLLPDIAHNLRVTEPQVGLLVTAFAGTVVLTSAPLTAVTRRVPRKTLVVVVLVGFALGNGLAAVAPNYEVLLVARIIGGAAHGLFGAVVGAYAGHLVPSRQLARAVAITSGGGSVAFVLGVPAGTLLGHAVGWRLAFAVIGAAVLALTFLVVRLLPRVDHRGSTENHETAFSIRRDPTLAPVLLICLIVIIIMLGQNTFYTYIAPFLISVGGIPGAHVGLVLLLYGIGGSVGLLLSGLVGGRYPRFGVVGVITLLAGVILIIGVAGGVQWVLVACLALWGCLLGTVPVLMQTRLLVAASDQLRDVAAAYMTTAYNIAIGLGALLGGALLEHFGLRSLPFGYLVFLVAAILLMMGAEWAAHRRRSRFS